ncbi:MAG: hypothetical protein M0R37_10380 [Bacteroidales bacterium]|jgi:hypothetical protein|nr:hypothetical protein [Bacteroidales bacterium]
MTEFSDAGFICECGHAWSFDGYARAHKRDHLTHTCPDCHRKHRIYNLTAVLVAGTEPKPMPEGLFPDLTDPKEETDAQRHTNG